MDLLGLPFLLLVLSVVLLICVAVAGSWSRWPRRLAWPGRALGLALVLGAGALLAGTLVNRAFGFYTSIADLLASPARTYTAPRERQASLASGVEVLTPGWQDAARRSALVGRGVLLDVRLSGAQSGITRDGLLYLPAAWSLQRDRALPTLELLHGYPGGPWDYRDQLDVGRVLDRETTAGRMPPVVAVLPRTYRGRASECVDAVGGERDETYLAVDVPAAVHRSFRTLPGRTLALLGYSEGGFCAVGLGLRHPDRVAAAASLSGYFTAGTDPHTAALYEGVRGARERSSPLWWVRHRAPTGPALLLVAARGDRDAVLQDRALAAAARADAPRLPLQVSLLPSGGHDFGVWRAALPGALDVLGRHLPMALAAPLPLPPDTGR